MRPLTAWRRVRGSSIPAINEIFAGYRAGHSQAARTDLLSVTGGGKARSFIDVWDQAIIRMLTEDVHRTELAQIQLG